MRHRVGLEVWRMRDIDQGGEGGRITGDGERGLIAEGCCLLRSNGWTARYAVRNTERGPGDRGC